MDTEFKFDLKQWNTLKTSGLAAYVQHPPPERIGWVLAQRIWLPDWRPQKWAMQVQHFDLTWESFEAVQSGDLNPCQIEPWDYYMVTAYERFITDDQQTVEDFFAQFIGKPEFAQHPDRVQCPHEYDNEELSEELPAVRSLRRRSVVYLLLCLKKAGRLITWQNGYGVDKGQIGELSATHFELLTEAGQKWLSIEPTNGLSITSTNSEGLADSHWFNSSRPIAYFPASLPIWSFAERQWVVPAESDE